MAHVKTIQDELREAHERLTTLVGKAREEDREFTDEERGEADNLTQRMQALDGKRKRNEGFTDLLKSVSALVPAGVKGDNGQQHAAPMPPGPPGVWLPAAPTPQKSLGAQFIETEVYADLRRMPKSGRWQTPVVELQAAVTLNPPGLLVPPGTTILPFLPYPDEWGVASLFSQGTLDGGMIQYLQETVWTNAAAMVAVGAAKPESTKTFELKQQGLIKLAHWIGCPDEFLEDVAGLRSFIDAQMRNGVIERLNDQLVNGSGTGGNIQGLITLPGQTTAIALPVGPPEPTGADVAKAIAQMRANIFGNSRLQPDAVVMHPTTWASTSSAMSSAGGYLAGPNTFGAGVPPSVWGLRVVETPEVPTGTVIVGAFKQGGQLYTKGGVSLQATNAHQDFFIKNITAIRAEIRVAIVYYRPQAFGLVTGAPITFQATSPQGAPPPPPGVTVTQPPRGGSR
jgi:HK97 family phage major capsid protein